MEYGRCSDKVCQATSVQRAPVNEHDLLSKLIETSASKDKPIIVKDSQNKIIGVISQSDLLKAVIEGGDGE